MDSSLNQTLLRPQQHRQRSLSLSRSGYTATACIYCGRSFAAVDERRAHESDHFVDPEYRIWECDLCHRRFYSSVAVEQHIHTKHTTCRFCASRRENATTALESADFFCGDCDRSFPDILAFLQHDHTAHISCQHCEQIGKMSDRASFDRHCCGCDVKLANDNELEQHYRAKPSHYHEHPEFEPKNSSTPKPPSGAMAAPDTPRRPSLNTSLPGGPQLSVTPATPVERLRQSSSPTTQSQSRRSTTPSASRYGLPPQLLGPAPTSAPTSSLPSICPECRIPFPDIATLARHAAFSFNVTSRCDAVFACPFSLLKHIEMGHCCQWSTLPAARTRPGRGRGRAADEDIRMQDR